MKALVCSLSFVLFLCLAAAGQTSEPASTQQAMGHGEQNPKTAVRLGELSIAIGTVAIQTVPSLPDPDRHQVGLSATIKNVGDSPVCTALMTTMETSMRLEETANITIGKQPGGSISELPPRQSIDANFRASIKNGSDPVKLTIRLPEPKQGCGDKAHIVANSEVSIPIGMAPNPLGAHPGTAPRKTDPEFPDGATTVEQPGSVVIRAVVGADGKIHDPQVVRSLGEAFDRKALDCVNEWRFEPAMNDGHKVDIPIHIEVAFKRK